VLKTVQPLERDYQEAQLAVQRAQEALASNENELRKLDERVKELQLKYKALTGQAETLRIQLEAAQGTLARASALLEKLGGESARWKLRMETFGARMEALPGASLIAGLATTTLGGVPEYDRNQHLQAWS